MTATKNRFEYRLRQQHDRFSSEGTEKLHLFYYESYEKICSTSSIYEIDTSSDEDGSDDESSTNKVGYSKIKSELKKAP